MNAIPLVPVEQITRGTDMFLCVPYSCKLPARTCVERRAHVRAGLATTAYKLCKNCALGEQVEKNSGVKFALAIETMGNGQKRIRGKRAPNHPTPISQKQLAALKEPVAPAPAPPTPSVPNAGAPPAALPVTPTVVRRTPAATHTPSAYPVQKAQPDGARRLLTVFRVQRGTPHPVRVACAALDFKARDADGEQMYVDTHFESEDAAWAQLGRNAIDSQKLAAAEYVAAKARLEKATAELAEAATLRVAVEEALRQGGEKALAPVSAPGTTTSPSSPQVNATKAGTVSPSGHIKAVLADRRWHTRAQIRAGFAGNEKSLDATLSLLVQARKVEPQGQRGAREYRARPTLFD